MRGATDAELKKLDMKPEHLRVILDIVGILKKHEEELSSIEILAVLSNVLGVVIAGQDPVSHSREEILRIVNVNMEMGNRSAVRSVLSTREPAGHA